MNVQLTYASMVLSLILLTGCEGEPLTSLAPRASERIEVRVATSEQCPNGGTELVTYVDANDNGVREENEVALTSNLICAGQGGSDGDDGTDGRDGSDGDDGTDGSDGYSVVYKITSGAAGCPYGGDTLTLGLDVNRNGVLDADDTQQQSMFICRPAPEPDPEPAFTCKARIVPSSVWADGYVVDVKVTPTGAALNAWTVGFTLPAGQRVVEVWNASLSGTTGSITASSLPYNCTVDDGSTLTFGMKVSRSHSGLVSVSTIRLNGVPCTE
jgi:cellulase/cellobiase CelA1